MRSPHPYRGWRQWPDDTGRLELERFNVLVWDHVKDRVADYLAKYGRPEQVTAWRDGTPYVAELAADSAGR